MKKLWVFLALVAMVSQPAYAEDIELYVKHNVTTDEKPRVMVLFDTSGSMQWDSQTGRQCYVKQGRYYYRSQCFKSTWRDKCYQYDDNGIFREGICSDSRLTVAKNAIKGLVSNNDDISFGLSRLYSSSGGYILNGIGSSNSEIYRKIDDLPASGATPLSETLWELYNYLKGGKVEWGTNGGNDRDKSIEQGSRYISGFKRAPGEKARCDRSINLILMTDGDPTNDTGSNSDIVSEYKNVFGTQPDYFDLNQGSGVTKNYLPALAELMYGNSRKKIDLYDATPDEEDFARVYTIGFGNGMSGTGRELLKLTAEEKGGGKYYHANTANDLAEKLEIAVTTIREESASFTSPTVSANADDQTQTGDNLYYTQFKPETHTRWLGNLKKLKLKGTEIVGQEKTKAINNDGAIDKNITTYWSESGSKDGNNIEEGGVNYALEKQLTRNVISDFDSGNLQTFSFRNARNAYGNRKKLAKKMGMDGASKAELKEVINWALGIDVNDEDGDGSTSDRRKDIFADPLHSKPVTMDYGNGDVRILVGTNAGSLHMFKDEGNTVTESWAFIPGDLLDILNDVKNRKADTKVYGMDGPITIYFNDENKDNKIDQGEQVWAFAGMRRGGNKYYGFDITNPDSPKLLWNGPISGDSNKFKNLGQTWSKPVVTFLEKSKERPVVIFGAGYNTNKDNVSRSEDGSVGVGFYVVDILSENADIVWSLTGDQFKGKHSIVASPTLTDSDYDGFTDRIYLADTGGSIWRIDIPGPNPTDNEEPWTHFELARLGSELANQDRRFFYQPTVARTFFSKVTEIEDPNNEQSTVKVRKDTPFDAIVIGSGNRAKPTDSSVNDYLFMVRDINTKTQSFVSDIPEPILIGDLMEMKTDPFGTAASSLEDFIELEVELAQFKGWKYQLTNGEKSLSPSTVVGGVAYFTSFTPADQTTQQCTLTGGKGQLYALHMHYGTGTKYITAQDIPDTPTIVVRKGDDGKTKIYIPGPGIEVDGDDGGDGAPAGNPLLPKGIAGSIPVVDPESGKVRLFKEYGISIKTRQLYIYKREFSDEKQ